MESANLSRRSLLQAIAAIIASAATPLGWAEVAQAMDAHAAPLIGADEQLAFFSTSDASDVEAVAAQIVPTDDSPGAREAGAVYFIDRALSSFFSQLGGDYRSQLTTFQAACRKQHPEAASFASLSSRQQVEFLRTIDQTPFFNTTRTLAPR